MGLETSTYVSDLVATNPLGSDPKSQGDNHLRLLKSVLQTTFPNANKPLYFPNSEAKSSDFSVLSSDQNKLFVITTSGGAVTATLPVLAAGDAGWECSFVKIGSSSNPYFVAPDSGTLQSGSLDALAKTRRSIPGAPIQAIWTGSEWFVTRAVGAPIGAILPFDGASLPVGYEWPNGQTLASASTNYPDYNAYKGSGATRDLRQRFIAGHNLDGSDAGRLTGQTGGVDGGTLGNTGGAETHELTEAQLATHNHGAGTYVAASHSHGAGTYSAASHTHSLGVSGSATTGNTNINHTHTVIGSTGYGDLNLNFDVRQSADLGGTDPHRLARANSAGDATTHGSGINNESHTHTVSGSTSSDGGTHGHSVSMTSTGTSGSSGSLSVSGTSTSSGPHTVSGSSSNTGSGAAHNNVPPVIILGFLLVVE